MYTIFLQICQSVAIPSSEEENIRCKRKYNENIVGYHGYYLAKFVDTEKCRNNSWQV